MLFERRVDCVRPLEVQLPQEWQIAGMIASTWFSTKLFAKVEPRWPDVLNATAPGSRNSALRCSGP
jgi:hypothetical protein